MAGPKRIAEVPADSTGITRRLEEGAEPLDIADELKVPVEAVYRVRREVAVENASLEAKRLAQNYITDMDALRDACLARVKKIGDRLEVLHKDFVDADTASERASLARAMTDSERSLLTFATTVAVNLSKEEFAEFIRMARLAMARHGTDPNDLSPQQPSVADAIAPASATARSVAATAIPRMARAPGAKKSVDISPVAARSEP